jgi:hypothetical protein
VRQFYLNQEKGYDYMMKNPLYPWVPFPYSREVDYGYNLGVNPTLSVQSAGSDYPCVCITSPCNCGANTQVLIGDSQTSSGDWDREGIIEDSAPNVGLYTPEEKLALGLSDSGLSYQPTLFTQGEYDQLNVANPPDYASPPIFTDFERELKLLELDKLRNVSSGVASSVKDFAAGLSTNNIVKYAAVGIIGVLALNMVLKPGRA